MRIAYNREIESAAKDIQKVQDKIINAAKSLGKHDELLERANQGNFISSIVYNMAAGIYSLKAQIITPSDAKLQLTAYHSEQLARDRVKDDFQNKLLDACGTPWLQKRKAKKDVLENRRTYPDKQMLEQAKTEAAAAAATH
jgi:hypothetical protein